MKKMTQGELAFYETRVVWEKQNIPQRRDVLRSLKWDEHLAECPFNHLPTGVRDAIIEAWQREHLDEKIGNGS